jgi:hypothetical protein
MEDGTVPVENSISICAYCHHIAIYRADQTLREPTDDELMKISQEKKVKAVMKHKPWKRTILGRSDS